MRICIQGAQVKLRSGDWSSAAISFPNMGVFLFCEREPMFWGPLKNHRPISALSKEANSRSSFSGGARRARGKLGRVASDWRAWTFFVELSTLPFRGLKKDTNKKTSRRNPAVGYPQFNQVERYVKPKGKRAADLGGRGCEGHFHCHDAGLEFRALGFKETY